MDHVLDNAKEIMMLCFGGGFLILVFVLARTIIIATRLMKKVDDLTTLAIVYANKPMKLLLKTEETVIRFLDKLGQ